MNAETVTHPARNDNPNARFAYWLTNPALTWEDYPSSDEHEEDYVQEAEAWEHWIRENCRER